MKNKEAFGKDILTTPINIAGFEVNASTHSILKNKEECHLEPKTMAVLLYLAYRQGQVVSREELETEIWKDMVVGYDALNNTIAKLRKAFQDDSKKPTVIQTVPKSGYRLIAQINQSPSSEIKATELQDSNVTEPRIAKYTIVSVLLVLLMILISGLTGWYKPWILEAQNPPQSPTSLHSEKPSLVSLPLKNLSQEAGHDLLSVAISEDINAQLSRFSELFVVSADSANRLIEQNKTPVEIGHALGVSYVVTGSMQRIGDHLRISMRLIDVDNQGRQVWTENFDRQVNDLFIIQDEIVRSVATSLGESIWRNAAAKLKAKPIENFAQYDFHLKAKQALHKFTNESNTEARKIWLKLIEVNPQFGNSYVGLAWTYYLEYSAQWTVTGPEILEKAKSSLQKASDIIGEHDAIHRLLAKINHAEGNFDKALIHSKRALELNPNDGDLLATHAQILLYSGKGSEALNWINEAIRRNPYYPGWYVSVRASYYYFQKDYLSAIDDLNRIGNLTVWDRRLLAASLGQLGRQNEATQQVNRLLKDDPNFSASRFKARIKYKRESDRQHYLDGLVKAGLPK